MKLHRTLMIVGCLIVPGIASAATGSLPVNDRLKSCDPKVALAAAEEQVKSPESLKEPLQIFPAAWAFFQHGKKEDGVFWFYAAQLRTRYQLAFEKDDRGQLLQVMLMTMGQPINNYAFQDTRKLDRTLERVLQWDRSSPNPYRDKPKSPEAEKRLQAVYSGFADLRKKIAAERAQLESQARAAAPQVEAAHKSAWTPPCSNDRMDPAYARQTTENEQTLVQEFVKGHPAVIREMGPVKRARVHSYNMGPGDNMPIRYEVSVNDSLSSAVVDVKRQAGKAEFTLLCVTHTQPGQRDSSKHVCKQ